MDNVPIDWDNPAVKDYLALVRLQVLTPLSLLINIATIIICSSVVKPSIGGISRMYPTSISPNSFAIAIYVAAIFAGEIGYCVLLSFVRKPETKRALVKAVGFSLVLANWTMAFWAVFWVLQYFLVATILQGLLILFLAYSNVALLIYHPPTSERPLDMALIHAPLRFFMLLPLAIMFPYSLFIYLGLYAPPDGGSGTPQPDSDKYAWPGFGVIITVNVLALAVVILRRDIVWCVASTWLNISMWTRRPKPAAVNVTSIVFTVVLPLALVAAYVQHYFVQKIRRPVRLEGEDPIIHRGVSEDQASGPREIDPEGWN
ncbi:hypothetical protein FISHEDRAFT_40483 [Fistulina hepatica ATCC 64428]|uniref:Uncharacterized protein n=1 Tax=Fistulina hepatica ATCC 64428 TaxID=1128425 RepID=A0A0D7AF61_9AGAR|nr:hypothetical protein FISHEDRAFT_40483 [Fistulina hepatica ATCC 64428]